LPELPITRVVPAAAGAQTETVARIAAEHMAKALGRPVVVEYIAGAGGAIAATKAGDWQRGNENGRNDA